MRDDADEGAAEEMEPHERCLIPEGPLARGVCALNFECELESCKQAFISGLVFGLFYRNKSWYSLLELLRS